MAKLAPYAFWQSFDDNGDPLNGGKVDTYEAGTSTPKATYTDESGDTANANPVILDSAGRADIWLDSGAYKFVIKDSADVIIATVDDITGDTASSLGAATLTTGSNLNLTSVYENYLIIGTATINISLLPAADASEGFVFMAKNDGTGTVTIDPDAAETINGSATLILAPSDWAIVVCDGTNWNATVYVNQPLHKFDATTAPTANEDSGDGYAVGSQWHDVTNDKIYLCIDSTLTAAIWQLVATQNYQNIFTKTQTWAKSADVASAAALPVLTDGNYFDVTGTTTITSIDTLGIGTVIKLHFDGILTLTHHATDLILPGGANITTAAGDEAEFIEYASGDWRCTSYTKASGEAVVGTTITEGTQQATTSGTAIDYTSIPSGTKRIKVQFVGVSTNGTDPLLVQLGDSGGVEATGYTSAVGQITGANNCNTGSSTSGFLLRQTNAAGDAYHGTLTLAREDAANFTWVADGVRRHASAGVTISGGSKSLTAELDRIRLTTTGGTDTFDAGAVNITYE